MEYDDICLCPGCGMALILYANGDNGPQDDRWTCDACGIEYPHHLFPLPKGYVREAKEAERTQALEQQRVEELAKLTAWNKAMRSA